jgi:ketosteroid isomerase-like protein
MHTTLLAVSLVALRALSPAFDTTATKAAVLQADRALAERAATNGPGVVLDAMEPSAAVLIPGQPIHSAETARAAFLARYGGSSHYTWTAAHAVASADGNFACTVGYSTFTFTFADESTAHRYDGAYVACWRRGVGGAWRIAALQRADMRPPTGTPWDAALRATPHSATTSMPGDPRTETQDTDMAFARFAIDSGTGRAFAHFAAPDAVNMLSQAYGPGEIGALFANYPGHLRLAWQPIRAFGAGSGGLGFNVGNSVLTRVDGAADPPLHGKFLTVWRQNLDGTWSYIFDLGSPQECRRGAWRLC